MNGMMGVVWRRGSPWASTHSSSESPVGLWSRWAWPGRVEPAAGARRRDGGAVRRPGIRLCRRPGGGLARAVSDTQADGHAGVLRRSGATPRSSHAFRGFSGRHRARGASPSCSTPLRRTAPSAPAWSRRWAPDPRVGPARSGPGPGPHVGLDGGHGTRRDSAAGRTVTGADLRHHLPGLGDVFREVMSAPPMGMDVGDDRILAWVSSHGRRHLYAPCRVSRSATGSFAVSSAGSSARARWLRTRPRLDPALDASRTGRGASATTIGASTRSRARRSSRCRTSTRCSTARGGRASSPNSFWLAAAVASCGYGPRTGGRRASGCSWASSNGTRCRLVCRGPPRC